MENWLTTWPNEKEWVVEKFFVRFFYKFKETMSILSTNLKYFKNFLIFYAIKKLQSHKNCVHSAIGDKPLLPLLIKCRKQYMRGNYSKLTVVIVFDVAYVAFKGLFIIIIIHCKVVCIMLPLAIHCNIHVYFTKLLRIFFWWIYCRMSICMFRRNQQRAFFILFDR